ncbi:MAG TPA: substrate-binding domain-containing protein [Anaerolineae bacterium]|nr:substrate-binding domain-containing protein [Anaerolineae bacterium]
MAHHTRPTIGVLAGWQFYWTATPLSYLNPIFHGIRSAALDRGCNVLFACGMGPSANPTDPLRPAWPVPLPDADFVPVGPWNTDGLIAINPLQSVDRSRYIQDLIAARHPVIFVGSGEVGPTIVADNAGGIRAAMQHLVEHGHRRIAFIAGTPEDLGGDSGDRLRAYQTAVHDFQLADEDALVTFGRHVYDGGYQAMQRLLAEGVTFSAILASNDESALGAMQALKEAGRRIPQDMALIGFDDRPESAIQTPALSSVQIPLFKLGYQAVEMILQQIERQPDARQLVHVPTRLITRESCGCGHRASHSERNAVKSKNASDRLQRMIEAVSREAQHTTADELQHACEALLGTFTTDQFEAALERILTQAAAQQEDIAIWQAAISILSEAHPDQYEPIDRARLLVADHLQRQHRQAIVGQQWRIDRLGVLTAHLLSALDEAQVFDVLAQHLPEMGIPWAGIAFFAAKGNDRMAVSHMRLIPSHAMLHFAGREFPPADLNLAEPFSLALLPLTHRHGLSGYAVFDTGQLELYGAIVQQLAAALNNAQLYREATEGRRLAEEANQLKSRFLSTVSHELRTPLNVIVGLSDLLLKESDQSGTPLPDRYRVDVERIHASGQHLGWLIGDVLDLASSEAGQLRLTNEVIDLGETLRTVLVIGQQLAEDKGLVWQASLPDAGLWVYGDRTRLRQVTLNLVANAVKFTRQGEVRLTVDVQDESVMVSIRDTGLGIATEEQEKIFDEFRRSERSLSRGYGGLGLGLAICKRLIELHGGSIGVRSSGEEGAGSTFFFTLPIVPPPVPATTGFTPINARAVVVLTNRSGGGEHLREHLLQRGFEVRVIVLEDTPNWSSSLSPSPPGAVILDSGLVPQQGWEVLKALKSNPATQHTPVLFYSLEHDHGSVLELDYLTKPIASSELRQALDQQWLADDSSGKAILIVDDDPNTVEMHTRLVQSHASGHRILKARHGREALDLLQRESVDLVLLDLMMPELDGFGVLAAMRDNVATHDIPVIVLTGQALTEKDMARLNRGVATVLRKGLFSVEETLAHLDAALERKRKLSTDAQRLVRQAMAYLHEHYAEAISREDLARHVGMSDDYLTHCFRQEVGMTPIAYLNRYRVDQAKQLLKNTAQSITDIALAVGFSDSGYFSRVFRREVGLSPEAFRREKN